MPGFAILVAALLIVSPPSDRRDDALTLAQNINAEREVLGRDALQVDPGLSRLALEHALEMAEHGYFSHVALDGTSPFARFDDAHVRFTYAGEDLEFDRNVTSAEEALWRSPAHRRTALLPDFTRMGVAAVRTAQGEFFVEDFSG